MMDHDIADTPGPHLVRPGNDAAALLLCFAIVLALLATASLSLDFCLACL